MQAAQQTIPPHKNNNRRVLRSPEGAKHGWTAERRARQSAAIRQWSPWTKSTGPRTPAGKARAAQNAAKPHLRHHPDRVVRDALAKHSHHLADLQSFLKMRRKRGQNELLNRRIKYRGKILLKRADEVIEALSSALLYAKLCKNLAFSPQIPIKVNAK